MADITLADIVDRLKAEGQLTRNTGTNSLKSIKQIMVESQVSGAEQKELDRERAVQDAQRSAVFTSMDDSLKEIVNILERSGEGAGGGLLGGLGGTGLGAILAGGGIGLGAAGAGVGAFFMGLAGAEAIMEKFGSGDNLKNLLINMAEGLAAFETRDLAAVGAVLGMGAVAGAVPGFSGTGAGMGMAAVGVGLGGFFVGLGIADKTLGWLGTDYSNLKNVTKNMSDALGNMSPDALNAAGGLLAGGAAAGALFSARRVGKATIGMGAIGLGIGAFFAGLAAGDAAASWMNTDGVALKNMMTNVGEGLAGLVADPAALAAVGTLLGAGAAGGALFGPSRVGTAAIGMGAVGLGLGAFFAGLAAGDAAASWMSADGTALKSIMKNLAEGLGAFSDGQLTGLSALLVTGGIFGAIPGGAAIAGGASIGMGIIGAGLGAFMVGIASVGSVAQFAGIDGQGIRDVMVNTATGLKAFNDLDGSNLLAVAGGLVAIGPALAAYLGAEGIGSLAGAALDKAGEFYDWVFGGDDSGSQDPSRNRIASIVEALQPFNDLDGTRMEGFIAITEQLDTFSKAVERIAESDASDLKKAFGDIGDAVAYGLPILDKMANGGVIGSRIGDGYSEMDFGRGLLDDSLRLDELATKMMQVRSILTGTSMMNALTVEPPVVQQLPTAMSTTGTDLENAQTSRPQTGSGSPVITDASTVVGPTTQINNQNTGVIRQESLNPYNPNQTFRGDYAGSNMSGR